jgi:hypothetical protein
MAQGMREVFQQTQLKTDLVLQLMRIGARAVNLDCKIRMQQLSYDTKQP